MNAASHTVSVLPSPCPGAFVTCSTSGLRFDRHWHATYSFGLLDEGAQSWASGRGRADAYPGDVIDTNPGEVHDGRPLGGPSRRWRIIAIDPALMMRAAGRDGATLEIVRPVIRDRELAESLRRVFTAVDEWSSPRPSPLVELAFEEALVESCTLLLGRHGSTPASLASGAADMRIVRDMLAAGPVRPPSLAQMAEGAGMSRFQVLRRFTRQFGLPPHRWLMSRRAERARALILLGTPLGAAAADAGFADQSHMTRVFRRLYGYTAGALRTATNVERARGRGSSTPGRVFMRHRHP
jgi:AraC-like DNA-binding protein